MQCRRQVLNCCHYDTAVKNKKKRKKRKKAHLSLEYNITVGGADFTVHTKMSILHIIMARFT